MTHRFSTILRILVLFVVVFFFAGAGCITFKTAGVDGGVFFSGDRGETWVRKVFVEEVKKKSVTIANVNAVAIVAHPKDSERLYLATKEDGLYATANSGEQWGKLPFPERSLKQLFLDPFRPSTLYVVTDKQFWQSQDEGQTWKILYTERRDRVTLTTATLHSTRTKELYLGFSSNDLLKSSNQGASWTLVKTFPSAVTTIDIPANGGDLVYLGTQDGFWKSPNAGKDWFDLSPYLNAYSGARSISMIQVDPRASKSLFLVSRYGLLKSADEGISWQPIPLLVPPGNLSILSFVVNPSRPDQELYYGTSNALFRTTDGGKSWVLKPLPTTRAATALVIAKKGLYLGVGKVKK